MFAIDGDIDWFQPKSVKRQPKPVSSINRSRVKDQPKPLVEHQPKQSASGLVVASPFA
jgi:hypothetical protein